MVLSKEQSEKVKQLSLQLVEYEQQDWYCEGTDWENGVPCFCIFSNTFDVYAVADWNENILVGFDLPMDILLTIKKIVKIEAKIYHIIYDRQV